MIKVQKWKEKNSALPLWEKRVRLAWGYQEKYFFKPNPCVRISGKIFFQTKDFVLSTILKQRNRASHKMVYYKKAPMLLNGNLANDSGQETIFVEWELLKVNLFVCFVCFFFFCCVKQRASFIYLKTQMSTHLKNDDPFCETDLKNFYTSKIHGRNTGQTFGWKRPRITRGGSTGLRQRQC